MLLKKSIIQVEKSACFWDKFDRCIVYKCNHDNVLNHVLSVCVAILTPSANASQERQHSANWSRTN